MSLILQIPGPEHLPSFTAKWLAAKKKVFFSSGALSRL